MAEAVVFFLQVFAILMVFSLVREGLLWLKRRFLDERD